jgi:hypothetical protein
MPNATVATTTGMAPRCHAACTSRRTLSLSFAWYADARTPLRVSSAAVRSHSSRERQYTMPHSTGPPPSPPCFNC